MDKLYCYNCNKLVNVSTNNKLHNYVINKKPIQFSTNISICNICNDEVYNMELENIKLKKAREIYLSK